MLKRSSSRLGTYVTRGRPPVTDITRRALTHPATSSAIGVLALFVLLTGIVGVSTVPASAQTSGLVAAYGFSEGAGPTVADGSGNNNTGTLGSGVTWTAAGRYGSALVFNGAGFVTVPNAAALQLTTAMTLSAWVNPTTVSSAWRDVIYKGNDNYYLSGTSTNASRPAGGGTFGGTTIETYGTAALAVNTWTHLAVTYDGATVRLYVNGAQVSSLARTGALTTSTNALQIGGDSIWGQYFQGMIDEVRVYNRALSAAEIGTDMSTAVGGGGNTAPTITPIANQTINEDTATGALSFTVGDAETAPGSLTVSGSSSNLGLVPNGNIVFGGSGANRTVTVTPAANQNGTATITVTVSDGQLSTPTSFLLTVTAVNDPPTITSIANQTTTAGTAVGPLSFTVGDVETPAGSLTVSGSSSNLTLVPTGNIVFGGTGARSRWR
ncbi:MAG: hypothetical protein DME04_26630 [Candidatus Rokuibacteriota bacterium]|nr:MAG: hypothetical protein DME04_26630 [Candidatus Rokubacteria bacterium]